MTLAPPDCSATAPRNQWRLRQWNQNYAIGGAGCLIRTLEGDTGLFVDHYAIVDFSGFKQMVDALGGVQVCTPVAIDDAHTHLRLAPGTHTLDGRQALQYVRVRTSIGDGSDLQRIGRQQAFLSSVMQKATSSQLLLEPTRLYAFLTAATKSLTTDPDLGVGTMRDLAGSVKGIGLDRIQFVTVPNEPYTPDPNRVQWTKSAEQIWSALRRDRPVGATERPTARPQARRPPAQSSPSPRRRHRHGRRSRARSCARPAGSARRCRSPSAVEHPRSSRCPTGWAASRCRCRASRRSRPPPSRSRCVRPTATSAPDPRSRPPPTRAERVLRSRGARSRDPAAPPLPRR